MKLHTLLLCPVPFLSCHLACLFWPGSLSSFLSSTQRFLAGQDRLFSRLGVYLAIWLFAWDSKYFPTRKHYTSVLPMLLLLSSKTLWGFFPLPQAVLCASTSNQEQRCLCSGVGWKCRAPVVSLNCWGQDNVRWGIAVSAAAPDAALLCAAGLQQHQRQEARRLHPGEVRDRDRHEHRHHLLQLPLL